MTCCEIQRNGRSSGGAGGGGGISAPGAFFWTFADDGGPADGIITTTDAVPVFRTWGTLPNVGAAINFFALFHGVSTDGNECLFRQQSIGYALNAIGEATLAPVAAVTQSGFDETGGGTAPWNNLVNNPPGWGGGANFLPGGNIIQVAFNGAALVTVRWSVLIIALPLNGATIQV